MKLALFLTASLLCATARAQDVPYAAFWNELVTRAAAGHSPTPDEITAAGTPANQPDAAAVQQAVPFIRKALASSDVLVRTCALTALIGLQVPATSPADATPSALSTPPLDVSVTNSPADAGTPGKPASKADTTPAPSPTAFRPAVAEVLATVVPELGRELTDEAPGNRILAATAISGFASAPPPAVLAPLLAYLHRNDGVGPAGDAVVDDLLLLGPVSTTTADGLIRYLRRTDQTADSRSNLIESISSHQNQSPAVNQALLAYLNTDDPSVRARLILSLPQLDLTPDVFADTRARVSILAGNDQENPQVNRAARAVATCWTAPRMPTGCPVN